MESIIGVMVSRNPIDLMLRYVTINIISLGEDPFYDWKIRPRGTSNEL
jgi:hypothetical protein